MLNRHAGAGVPQLAAASAVELHFMCETLAKDGSKQITQQQQQQQGNSQAAAAAAAAGVIPPVQSFADLAARGVDGSVIANVSSNGSIGALHTLGRDDSSGRLDSNCGRISSRSNLLPCGGVSSSAVKGSSKLGDQAAAGVADATARVVASGSGAAGARKARVQKQKGQNMFRRFVQQHPLLCHIVRNQAQVCVCVCVWPGQWTASRSTLCHYMQFELGHGQFFGRAKSVCLGLHQKLLSCYGWSCRGWAECAILGCVDSQHF
jgi:hypothetical protein